MTKPVGPSVDGFSRYRIDFGYDGTEFNGFAKQPGLRTVQGELLRALSMIFGEDQRDFGMRVAGRTDAGVHAEVQVAHVDLTPVQLGRIGRNKNVAARLNTMLPGDVRIRRFEPALPGFDARYSASFRRYRYRIADGLTELSPLQTRYTLQLGQRLKISEMRKAAKVLLGLHDFAAFCKPRAGATTIRKLQKLTISRNQTLGGVIEVELLADAFCHNMVRSIVGALVAVGSSRATPEDVETRLRSASRVNSYKVAAAHGLSLIEVGYPEPSKLARQAEKARNLRSLDEN